MLGNRTLFPTVLALASLFSLATFSSHAAEYELQDFGKREFSEHDLINALTPEPKIKTRGITPVETTKPKAVSLQVPFGFNSATLSEDAKQILNKLGGALTSELLRDSSFLIEGHTDSKGSDAYNQQLSERRAEAAARYLQDQFSIPVVRLKTQGKGEEEPLNKEDPEAGENRRVQIVNLGQ
jgi:outer membrane protein OmpA-like peptidoglycan-associated protein